MSYQSLNVWFYCSHWKTSPSFQAKRQDSNASFSANRIHLLNGSRTTHRFAMTENILLNLEMEFVAWPFWMRTIVIGIIHSFLTHDWQVWQFGLFSGDAGAYSCAGSNQLGSVVTSAQLILPNDTWTARNWIKFITNYLTFYIYCVRFKLRVFLSDYHFVCWKSIIILFICINVNWIFVFKIMYRRVIKSFAKN